MRLSSDEARQVARTAEDLIGRESGSLTVAEDRMDAITVQ